MFSQFKKILIYTIIRILSLLPLSGLRFLGIILALLLMKLSSSTLHRMKKNILKSKICPVEQIEQFIKKSAWEMGKTLVESLLLIWVYNYGKAENYVKEITGCEIIDNAIKNNQAIVFLTPHLGNFEMGIKCAAKLYSNHDFTVLYKPTKNPLLNQLMLQGRSEKNVHLAATNKRGVLSLFKAIQQGQFVGILPDSVASSGGVWVKFFGHPVYATTLAAKLIQQPKVQAIFASCTRIVDGFRLDFTAFDQVEGEISQVVQNIYTRIEQLIAQAPTQYFWSYDRYRIPAKTKTANS